MTEEEYDKIYLIMLSISYGQENEQELLDQLIQLSYDKQEQDKNPILKKTLIYI